MSDRILTAVALVLGASSLAAQAPTQKPAPVKPAAPAQTSPYTPAIMQPRLVTLVGCLQQKGTYILVDAAVAPPSEKEKPSPAPAPSYLIEGLSAARLSLLVGKRVTINGAYQEAPTGKGSAAGTTTLPRFEATNATEVAGGTCSSAG
jgi:hypothetical protein